MNIFVKHILFLDTEYLHWIICNIGNRSEAINIFKFRLNYAAIFIVHILAKIIEIDSFDRL
jgi:hypothetical protein